MAYQVLTPMQMFEIIARERAWMFNPGGQVIADERAGGAMAGGTRAGASTFALIQVVDGGGSCVCLARGDHVHFDYLIAPHHRDERNQHYHAEEKALNTLRTQLGAGATFPGGAMTVVVDQEPCGKTGKGHNCREKLRKFADERGLALEIWLPRRPKQVGAGYATPKTATRSSMRTGYPAVELVPWAG